MMRLHASCVAVGGKSVLLAGPSSSGKSDLALRLIDGGATLVADDQVELVARTGQLFAAPPSSIVGKIEARHLGILTLPYVADVLVGLYVWLGTGRPERLPEPAVETLLDIAIPRFDLPAFEASTPAKIRLALRYSFLDFVPNSSPNSR